MTIAKDAYSDYDPSGMDAGQLPLVENCRVLEIGFGSCALLEELQKLGNELYGVDAGEEIVRKGKGKGFSNLSHLDISEEPLPFEEDFFDAIYAYEVFEHLTNPHRMFYEIRRVLKPGCMLYFSVPTQEHTMGYGPGRHSFVYPGLLERNNLERFFMQMYFRVEMLLEDEPKLITHRSYILENMKKDERPDIVEVITGDYNVRNLYGDFLSDEAIENEVARDVEPYLVMAERFIIAKDWNTVDKVANLILSFHPAHYPAYFRLAEMLVKYGEALTALAILQSLISREGVPSEIIAKASAVADSIRDGKL